MPSPSSRLGQAAGMSAGRPIHGHWPRCASRGLDADDHRARQFTSASFDDYDLVLALDRDNMAELHLLAPDDGSRTKIQMLRAYDPIALASGDLDVQDPYYGGDDGFDRVIDQIDPAVDGLVQALRRELDDESRPR